MVHASGMSHASREDSEILFPQFLHTTANGSALLELHEESDGTQCLYGLAAPILDVHGPPPAGTGLGRAMLGIVLRNAAVMFVVELLIMATLDTAAIDS